MKRILKSIALLLVLFATTFSFTSCSEKEEVENVKLSDTSWRWSDENAATIIDLSVEFNGPKLASLIYTDMTSGVMETDVLLGSYSVSGNEGSLSLRDEDAGTSVNVDFTVNGSKMTLKFRGVTYVLIKE